MKYVRILALIVCVVSIAPGSLQAASSMQTRSLRDVKVVRVVVEELNAATQKTGLRKEQVQALAENQLRTDGLTVLRAQERGKVPLVYIRLSSVVAGNDGRAPVGFYLTVQVKQLATLVEESRTSCSAESTQDAPNNAPLLVTTWEDGTMVMADRKELFFYVQTVLTNLLSELVTDYQDASKIAAASK